MALVVQKYGGTSVGNTDRIKNVARRVAESRARGDQVVVEGSRIRRMYRITDGRIEGRRRRGKADIADYVLEYRNTKLAVVEAKAWDGGLTEGVGQAKGYADKLAVRFAFSANGRGIDGIDMQAALERE